jgi:hypothetical protein
MSTTQHVARSPWSGIDYWRVKTPRQDCIYCDCCERDVYNSDCAWGYFRDSDSARVLLCMECYECVEGGGDCQCACCCDCADDDEDAAIAECAWRLLESEDYLMFRV